jgi:hypothetical protein
VAFSSSRPPFLPGKIPVLLVYLGGPVQNAPTISTTCPKQQFQLNVQQFPLNDLEIVADFVQERKVEPTHQVCVFDITTKVSAMTHNITHRSMKTRQTDPIRKKISSTNEKVYIK